MKSIIKNNPDKKYRRRVAIEKTAAAATVAVIVSSALSGCEFDSGTGNVTPPISGQTVATETADPTPTITVAPTATPTPAIGGSGTTNYSEVVETTSSEDAATENTPIPEPTAASNSGSSGGSSGGSGGGNGQNSSVTSTPKPTATPKPTPNPYKDRVDCPSCGDDHAVRYREARTVHHDAVTHEEKVVTYDKEIRTFQYTINWTGNFKSWCSDNGFSVPSAPSAKGDVVYDAKGKVIDSSGEKDALNSITEKAHELAADLGYTEVAYSYTTKEVNKSYVNRVETTKTVVDKEAWDETIPAGWYCDNENCSYYSSKEPEAYHDMDL